MIDPDTIARAREIIAAASKPPYTLGTIAGENIEQHVEVLREMLAAGDGPPVALVIPDGDKPIEKSSLAVAITGNGPTSRANALYFLHSHDPVGGWAACLDEIERLQAEVAHVRRRLSFAGDRPEGT